MDNDHDSPPTYIIIYFKAEKGYLVAERETEDNILSIVKERNLKESEYTVIDGVIIKNFYK